MKVQLVRSLKEVRNKAEQHKFPMNSGRIPVVRDLEMCAGKGLLSHRQQKWVEGMPNDDFTENPVLYRYRLEVYIYNYSWLLVGLNLFETSGYHSQPSLLINVRNS